MAPNQQNSRQPERRQCNPRITKIPENTFSMERENRQPPNQLEFRGLYSTPKTKHLQALQRVGIWHKMSLITCISSFGLSWRVIRWTSGNNSFKLKTLHENCFFQTLPCMSQTLPCMSQTLPCMSQTLPCMSQTLPCMSQTLPCMSQNSGTPQIINCNPFWGILYFSKHHRKTHHITFLCCFCGSNVHRPSLATTSFLQCCNRSIAVVVFGECQSLPISTELLPAHLLQQEVDLTNSSISVSLQFHTNVDSAPFEHGPSKNSRQRPAGRPGVVRRSSAIESFLANYFDNS